MSGTRPASCEPPRNCFTCTRWASAARRSRPSRRCRRSPARPAPRMRSTACSAQVEAGQFVDYREAASPVGTTVVVKELFFNAPVRLKFLKKPAAEAALVSDYLMRLILSRPDIAFRFASDGKTVYRSVGDGKLDKRDLRRVRQGNGAGHAQGVGKFRRRSDRRIRRRAGAFARQPPAAELFRQRPLFPGRSC